MFEGQMKKIFLIFGLTILLSAALIGFAVTTEAAKDPVCGMDVDPATAAVSVKGENGTVYFCSEHCKSAFCANPSAYMDEAKLQKIGIDSGKEELGCGGCPVVDHAEEMKGCDGLCGNTKVKALNDFHSIMHAIESAVEEGKTEAVIADAAVLAQKKDAVMEAECPDNVCMQMFDSRRAEFGEKVDAFLAACKQDDHTAIQAAFAEMHDAYGTLDQSAR